MKDKQVDSKFVDNVINMLRESEALLIDLRSDLHTHYGFADGLTVEENRQKLQLMMEKITRYLNRKSVTEK